MSIHTAKLRLSQLLNDDDVKVIALSGDWGTGKTHAWLNVKKVESAKNPKIKDAIYVSLFGCSSLQALKTEIVFSNSSSLWRTVSSMMDKTAKKILGSAIEEDMIALSLPHLAKDKLIVLDDIERKNSRLSLDEVLGFIDITRQAYGTRFLLLLNEDRLGEGVAQWDMMREKVIDEEVCLNTSPSEAFEIALSQISTHERLTDLLRKACVACELCNIRVIMKVIRVVNLLFNGPDVGDAAAKRLIPRTVLLAATRYRGIENGPTLDYIVDFDSTDTISSKADDEKSKERATHERLMQRLGIDWTDDFDVHVARYLTKGEFDQNALDEIKRQYVFDANGQEALETFKSFTQLIHWHPKLSADEILHKAEKLVNAAAYVSPRRLTSTIDLIKKFMNTSNAQTDVRDSLIDRLLTAWEKNFDRDRIDDFHLETLMEDIVLNPRIVKALEACRAKLRKNFTLLEASENFGDEDSENATRIAFAKATVDDYIATLSELNGDSLRAFTLQHFRFINNATRCYDQAADAADKFVSACSMLYKLENSNTRLPEILRQVFISKNLLDVLEAGKLPLLKDQGL